MRLPSNNLYLLKIVDFGQTSNWYQEKMINLQEEIKFSRDNENENLVVERFKKNWAYEWSKVFFEWERPFIWFDTPLDLENEKNFDFWKNEFNIEKCVHFDRFGRIHYEITHKKHCIPFIIKFENICGLIERGEEDDRNHYFKPVSLLQSGLIHGLFAQITELSCNLLKIDYHSLDHSVKFEISSLQKLPLNKITYFRNLVVVFEKVTKKIVRRKEKHKIIARIIDGEVLLLKK